GGMIGFYIVVFIVRLLNHTSLKKEVKVTIATAIGSYIAIVLASFICGIEISIGGNIPVEIAILSMVFWHLIIGLGEGIISALIVYYIYKTKPEFITTESIMGVK
ncbi:MAG: energy-coupling factor ABC transporter permease, partial [Candidatus Lokiarchaeota archaeon]|nr:energy-coupling factor ABC transporter permease [Candidatus Lokiarchaeota archaeon]